VGCFILVNEITRAPEPDGFRHCDVERIPLRPSGFLLLLNRSTSHNVERPEPTSRAFRYPGAVACRPHRLSAVTWVPRYASPMDLIDVLVWPGGAGIAVAPVLPVGSRLDLSLPVSHLPHEPDTADALD